MAKLKNITSKIAAAFSAARGDIDQIRQDIEKTQAEILTIEAAPLPIEAALQRFEDEMERRRQEAERAISVYHFTERDFPGWQFRLAPERVLDGVLWSIAVDTIRANVRERLAQFYAGAGRPLSDDDQAANLRSLRASLLDLERREEAMITEAEGAGVKIPRRDGVRPDVFLEMAED